MDTKKCKPSSENLAKVFGACHTKRFSTLFQTHENVTKCHACHAKRHWNLFENLRKREVLQLPPSTRRRYKKTRESIRDMLEPQNEGFSLVREFFKFSHFVASKSTFSYDHLKIDVSCQALRQFSSHMPDNANLQKKHMSEMLRLPRKMVTKCHQSVALATKKRNSSYEAKVFAPVTQSDVRHIMKPAGMSQSATPATRHEATRRLKPSKVDSKLQNSARGTATRCGTVCEQFGAVWRTHPSTPKPPESPEWKRGFREKWYPYACQEVVSREVL